MRRLLEQDADVVVLIRDWDPQSQLIRSGDVQRTRVVNGVLEDYATLELAINEHEPATVFHFARGEIKDQSLDSGKAWQLLGWSPSYSLEQKLTETIRWHRHYLGQGPSAITAS